MCMNFRFLQIFKEYYWFLWYESKVEISSYVKSTSSAFIFHDHLNFTNFLVGPTKPQSDLQAHPCCCTAVAHPHHHPLVVVSNHPVGPTTPHLAFPNSPHGRLGVLTTGLTWNPVGPTWIGLTILSHFQFQNKFYVLNVWLICLFWGPQSYFPAYFCSPHLFGLEFTRVDPTLSHFNSFPNLVNCGQLLNISAYIQLILSFQKVCFCKSLLFLSI